MFNKFFFLMTFVIGSSAMAETLPLGSFSLQKGNLGCPTTLQMDQHAKCDGFVMRDSQQKTETLLCNINNGKYLQHWKEEGIEFFVESRTKQFESLLTMVEVRKGLKDKKVLKKTKMDLSLFYRGGKLELQRNKDGKAVSCLYRRDPNLNLSASTEK